MLKNCNQAMYFFQVDNKLLSTNLAEPSEKAALVHFLIDITVVPLSKGLNPSCSDGAAALPHKLEHMQHCMSSTGSLLIGM